MDRIIARCGIECTKCDAYIATKSNDDALRKTTAENWSKMFNADIEAKDINCLGCNSEVLFSHCFECDVRKCNNDKSQENCSECSDYGCDRIDSFFKMVPEAKTVLDSLRQNK